MATIHVVTHPEVVIDPELAVTAWHLSPTGIGRMRLFAEQAARWHIAAIWSSCETKAVEAAGILAGRLALPVVFDAGLGENDRSATGYLPPPVFEATADAFFARPEESVRGWERAVDAQNRILAAVDRIDAASPAGSIAIVAHGAVGTLLQCHCLGRPITRALDQAFQGHHLAIARATRAVLHGWRPIAPRPIG